MNWLQRLFQRQRLEEELDRELRYHVERRTLELMAEGMDAREAARRARLEFGGSDVIKEECRDARGTRWLEDLAQDVRHGLRVLGRSPAFTAVAILSLALGIGANTAAFSLIDAVLLKPLPVREPEQLRILNYAVTNDTPINSHSGYNNRDESGRRISSSFSYDGFRSLQSVHEFESVVGFTGNELIVRTGDANDTASAQFVSGNYFDGLGVQAVRGRALTEADDRPGAPAVAAITEYFWRQRLGLREDAIGQTIYVNQIPITIVGVLPRGFHGLTAGRAQDVFLPLSLMPQMKLDWLNTADPYTWFVQAFGRLRPGVSETAAAAAIQSVLTAQIATYAPEKPTPEIVLNPGSQGVSGLFLFGALPAIWMLTAASALVLIICCVNLANLLLGRGAARSREIAVRLSIGASRWRIMRHLLTESGLLVLAGSALGLMLAGPLLNLFLRYLSGQSTLSLDARLDERALLFTFAICVAAALFFGTLPAWKLARVPVVSALKENQGGGHLIARSPISRGLVVVQVALSMLLLTGAAMLARTFTNLSTSDLGFAADHLLLFHTDPARAGYEGPNVAAAFARIRESLEALPGVDSVALSQGSLLQGSSSTGSVHIPVVNNDNARAWFIYCSDSFTRTMGIPLIAGRALNFSDTASSERVAVVSEEFIRSNMPGVDPLGQIIYIKNGPSPGVPKTPPIRIVGIVRNAAYASIREETRPTMYLPYTQVDWRRGMTFLVRTRGNPLSLAGPVRAALASIDPELPVVGMRTQEEQVALSLGREQLLAWLSSGFGILAAALAAIGLYGVMAYTVSRRTQEFGIRLALGATHAHVQWITLRASVWMIGIGLAVGAGAALILTKYLESILYRVTSRDTTSFAAAAALMIAAGILAAWIPARRAARVDPMTALRQE